MDVRGACGLFATALCLLAEPALGIHGLLELPPVYRIEGFIDRAPEKTKVIDEVNITAPGKPTRQLLVTDYRAVGGVLLDRYLSRELMGQWVIGGDREMVDRLLTAPAGAAVEGTFVVYTRGYPHLVIGQLDKPS